MKAPSAYRKRQTSTGLEFDYCAVHASLALREEGYETIIGERGYRLSGGEKQRISLARCLIRNPEILLLDEATSNLDSCSESFIQNTLEKCRANKTMLVVAHRLSTITKADQICVIENGQIVEKGTHADLLKLGEKYHSFWSLQSEAIQISE